MRRRNALLDTLELLRDTNADFTVNQLIVLLHVGDEAAPLPLPDLRRRAAMTGDAAWKSATALAEIEVTPGQALIAIDRWTMSGIVAAELTGAGRALCDRLDLILRAAQPIQPVTKPVWETNSGAGA